MKNIVERIASMRLWPLMKKELLQIRRNRRLVISLIIPPTLQIIIFGFALNPEVTGLRLGVVDMSRSAESRELISAFGESRAFDLKSYYNSADQLGQELSRGNLDIGLVIPWDFSRKRVRKQTADVQLLLDAVNTNTAEIAGGYASLIIQSLNSKIIGESPPAVVMPSPSPQPTARTQANSSSSDASQTDPMNGTDLGSTGTSSSTSSGVGSGSITLPPIVLNSNGPKIGRASIMTRIALLFNPGLVNSWFIITGTLGILLVLNGSVVSSATMIKEKEIGTIEQLLMTPATATEITIAKIGPLFILLVMEIILTLVTGYLVFGVPVRGSMLLLIFAGSLCVLAGIGIGITVATFTHSQQQAQLMGFFINPPISMLSGATYPIEGMPRWMQPITMVNPVRHFSIISRGVMLKGVGLEVLWPNLLVLLGISLLLIGISSWRFRKQLG